MKHLVIAAIAAIFCTSANAQVITPGVQPHSLSLPGPKVAGRFYTSPLASVAINAAVPAANRLFASPVYVSSGSVLKTLSFDIGTGNASAWNARMCLYADNGSGAPGSLVSDSGTVAIASGSVTGVQTATLSQSVTLGEGWYWLAFMADSSGESLFSVSGGVNGTSGLQTNALIGSASVSNMFSGSSTSGVYMAQTFGACPANFGVVTLNSAAATPLVVMGF